MGDAIKEAVVKLSVEQDIARIKAPSTDPITKWKNAQVAAHRDVVRSAKSAERDIQRELDRTAAKIERNIALYRTMAAAAASAMRGGTVPFPGGGGRGGRGGKRAGIVAGLMDFSAGAMGGGFGGMGGGYGGGYGRSLNPIEMVRDYFGRMTEREYARTLGRTKTFGRMALGAVATPTMAAIGGVGAAAISAAYIVNREATAGLDDWNRRNLWRPEGAPIPEVASRPSSRAVAMLGRFRAPAGQQYVTNADNERLRRMYAAISEREMLRDERLFGSTQEARSLAFSGYGASGRDRFRASRRANRRLAAAMIDPRRLAFEQSEAGEGSGFAASQLRRVESQINLRQDYIRGIDQSASDAQAIYNEGINRLAVRERGIVGAQRGYDSANVAYRRERSLVRGAEASIGGVGTREEMELKRILGRVQAGKELSVRDLNTLGGLAGQDDRVAAYVEGGLRRQYQKRGLGDALDAAFGKEHKGLEAARGERDAARRELDELTGGKGSEAALKEIAKEREALADELEETFKRLTKVVSQTLEDLKALERQQRDLQNAVGSGG